MVEASSRNITMNMPNIYWISSDAYEQKFGIDIYALSGWNEPDKLASLGGWATCAWSEKEEMAKFVLEKLRPKAMEKKRVAQ